MKILIIDDEGAIAQVFQQALQQGGYDVVLASTGQEGKAKAHTDKPNLILLDQILPDINGNQILKELKQDEETKHIPIAIISNFNQDDLVADAIKNGAVEYILKYQISPADLLEKVKQMLSVATQGSGWQDTHDEGV